ncbi:50S ribosomal protein L29 [Stenotrophobium rhamnosiphilum]|uniref:Large ribosomal subunit protein uL29 n=1 Tax=Stenotrophobium rhamnosiphilum TaxID=2029166 RepID=A0A2T5MBT7_9GAMM|nr:50S ribosomal protein L29 [Stenotrophobium rhamnosiphilum]
MKTTDYVKALRGKNAQELNAELEALRKEQFNLRMQKAIGQQNKGSLTRDARKKIARTKTVQRQQQVKAS